MRRRKKLAIIGIVIGLIAIMPLISREYSLRGLPDVGDPFDVAKYGHVDVADNDNAFMEYTIASTMLTRNGGNKLYDQLTAVTKADWSKAGDELKSWLSNNQARSTSGARGPRKAMRFIISRTHT